MGCGASASAPTPACWAIRGRQPRLLPDPAHPPGSRARPGRGMVPRGAGRRGHQPRDGPALLARSAVRPGPPWSRRAGGETDQRGRPRWPVADHRGDRRRHPAKRPRGERRARLLQPPSGRTPGPPRPSSCGVPRSKRTSPRRSRTPSGRVIPTCRSRRSSRSRIAFRTWWRGRAESLGQTARSRSVRSCRPGSGEEGKTAVVLVLSVVRTVCLAGEATKLPTRPPRAQEARSQRSPTADAAGR